MTGHIVGLDPMTDRIVVLRKGADGKASRQVDVLTEREARALAAELEGAVVARRSLESVGVCRVPQITATPEPEQVMLDLDSITEGNTP